MKRIVIVGATSAIAEHCARIWVTNSSIRLTLVGRDEGRLGTLQADLSVRSPNSIIDIETLDFEDPIAIAALADRSVSDGDIDIVLIAHGNLPNQQACEQDLVLVSAVLAINGLSPALFAEAFAAKFALANHGTIALIGSVAGDRARRANYVYGAAKALIAHYGAGLQHRFAETEVKIVLIKPGPTATPMTADLQAQGRRLAQADRVAASIVRAIDKGQSVVYTPAIWRFIMFVVRILPQGIFNKLKA
ncbi:MAG TPA: SDR family NAD(P)-dependent oxidoreductase [Candidatus Nanopelagicaceae bacterium]|nr:SDR family NAD(P)-dependent oxidoreductase [Candidatus Nanopelagicaceae bacterium]